MATESKMYGNGNMGLPRHKGVGLTLEQRSPRQAQIVRVSVDRSTPFSFQRRDKYRQIMVGLCEWADRWGYVLDCGELESPPSSEDATRYFLPLLPEFGFTPGDIPCGIHRREPRT